MARSQIVAGPEHAVLARAIGASHARVRWVHAFETVNPKSKKRSNTPGHHGPELMQDTPLR